MSKPDLEEEVASLSSPSPLGVKLKCTNEVCQLNTALSRDRVKDKLEKGEGAIAALRKKSKSKHGTSRRKVKPPTSSGEQETDSITTLLDKEKDKDKDKDREVHGSIKKTKKSSKHRHPASSSQHSAICEDNLKESKDISSTSYHKKPKDSSKVPGVLDPLDDVNVNAPTTPSAKPTRMSKGALHLKAKEKASLKKLKEKDKDKDKEADKIKDKEEKLAKKKGKSASAAKEKEKDKDKEKEEQRASSLPNDKKLTKLEKLKDGSSMWRQSKKREPLPPATLTFSAKGQGLYDPDSLEGRKLGPGHKQYNVESEFSSPPGEFTGVKPQEFYYDSMAGNRRLDPEKIEGGQTRETDEVAVNEGVDELPPLNQSAPNGPSMGPSGSNAQEPRKSTYSLSSKTINAGKLLLDDDDDNLSVENKVDKSKMDPRTNDLDELVQVPMFGQFSLLNAVNTVEDARAPTATASTMTTRPKRTKTGNKISQKRSSSQNNTHGHTNSNHSQNQSLGGQGQGQGQGQGHEGKLSSSSGKESNSANNHKLGKSSKSRTKTTGKSSSKVSRKHSRVDGGRVNGGGNNTVTGPSANGNPNSKPLASKSSNKEIEESQGQQQIQRQGQGQSQGHGATHIKSQHRQNVVNQSLHQNHPQNQNQNPGQNSGQGQGQNQNQSGNQNRGEPTPGGSQHAKSTQNFTRTISSKAIAGGGSKEPVSAPSATPKSYSQRKKVAPPSATESRGGTADRGRKLKKEGVGGGANSLDKETKEPATSIEALAAALSHGAHGSNLSHGSRFNPAIYNLQPKLDKGRLNSNSKAVTGGGTNSNQNSNGNTIISNPSSVGATSPTYRPPSVKGAKLNNPGSRPMSKHTYHTNNNNNNANGFNANNTSGTRNNGNVNGDSNSSSSGGGIGGGVASPGTATPGSGVTEPKSPAGRPKFSTMLGKRQTVGGGLNLNVGKSMPRVAKKSDRAPKKIDSWHYHGHTRDISTDSGTVIDIRRELNDFGLWGVKGKGGGVKEF